MNNQLNIDSEPLSKVPRVDIYFWVTKIIIMALGKVLFDYISNEHFAEMNDSFIVVIIMTLVTLFLQMRGSHCNTLYYWVSSALVGIIGVQIVNSVAIISVTGLYVSLFGFAGLMLINFSLWIYKERIVSFSSIAMRRKEIFYWSSIVLTSLFGITVGYSISQVVGFGAQAELGLFVVLTIISVLLCKAGIYPALNFWVAYISTIPVSLSLGNLLTQNAKFDGYEIGAMWIITLLLGVKAGQFYKFSAFRK